MLRKQSICVFSDCNTHNTVAVHSFLKVLIDYLKDMYPNLKKNVHFTDGAASQYKNYKNFINLLHQKNDFQLDGEWHFFATSHGKGPCDGIGGTIKDYLEEPVCKVKPIFKLRCGYLIGVNITSEISNAFSCHQTTFP